MSNIVEMNTVDQYNKLYGLETLHPLITVVDLTKATKIVNHIQMNYGVYALFLKGAKSCDIKYGRRSYDYQEGTIVCFAPEQVISVDSAKDEIQPQVYGILFHPDLIRGTSLGQNIKKFSFFSYAVNEALHLSAQERIVIKDCLDKIQSELQHSIDNHSKHLIVTNIELLLGYCMRFYERQFITRSDSNKDVLTRFELLLDEYFQNKLPQNKGLPSVKYIADKICLSANYFGDLIKKETGKTAQELIQKRLLDRAKEQIIASDQTISQIAYELGFQYPQHLSRFFKKHVGCTPNEYRLQN